MKRFVAIWCLLLMVFLAEGQTNVEIVGTGEGCAGKSIALFGYSDMLTCEEEELDHTVIDSNGAFALSCYANYPRLVFVQVESFTQSFYIEPGRRYEVYIPQFDWDLGEKRNIFLDPVALPLEFLHVDSNELNLRIMRFENTVDSFLSVNRERLDFKFRPDRKVFRDLERLVAQRFPASDDDLFFSRMVEYQLAEMRLAMHLDSRKKLIERYINDQPIRYHDENYMRLFLSLFEHSISGGMKRVPQWRMVRWISMGDLGTYLDSLGLDPLLQNEQVRELAVLQALKESYYDKNYDRAGVRHMVELIAERTKFDDHRTLARLLLKYFDRAAVSGRHAKVESFSLPDVDKQLVSIDDFRGKWVYLSFVRVGDPNSLREIETMAHFRDSLYAKHPDVVMVSVSCDREFQKMYHFLKNSKKGNRYRWTWLHFDGNYRLLERYGVVSYPTFLLVDPQGRLHYTVTPPPASGILMHGPWEQPELPDYSKPHFEQ